MEKNAQGISLSVFCAWKAPVLPEDTPRRKRSPPAPAAGRREYPAAGHLAQSSPAAPRMAESLPSPESAGLRHCAPPHRRPVRPGDSSPASARPAMRPPLRRPPPPKTGQELIEESETPPALPERRGARNPAGLSLAPHQINRRNRQALLAFEQRLHPQARLRRCAGPFDGGVADHLRVGPEPRHHLKMCRRKRLVTQFIHLFAPPGATAPVCRAVRRRCSG